MLLWVQQPHTRHAYYITHVYKNPYLYFHGNYSQINELSFNSAAIQFCFSMARMINFILCQIFSNGPIIIKFYQFSNKTIKLNTLLKQK